MGALSRDSINQLHYCSIRYACVTGILTRFSEIVIEGIVYDILCVACLNFAFIINFVSFSSHAAHPDFVLRQEEL